MQSELSCALVLVAFMTIELPEDQGLREKSASSNTRCGDRLPGCVCIYCTEDCLLLMICSHNAYCEGARRPAD